MNVCDCLFLIPFEVIFKTSLVVLYSQNYAAGKRWYNVYYQESSHCVEYPPKIPTDETKSFCETAPKSLFSAPTCVPGFEYAPCHWPVKKPLSTSQSG